MSDDTQHDTATPAEEAPGQVPEAAPSEAPAPGETQVGETPAAAQPDPAQEIAELKDKLLRAMAEAENTRRIAAREKQDAAKYAAANFARDILRVADYLGFAMMSVTPEARQGDKNLDNLCVGIDMTMKELLSVFEAHGIRPVPAEGQPFDHNLHEAVNQEEHKDVPENTVLRVMRGGFTIQGRLLRPAQVVVSTGGPKGGGQGGAQEAAAPAEAAPGKANEGQKAYETQGPGESHAVDQET